MSYYREPTPEQLALREQIKAQYPYLIDRDRWNEGRTKKISSHALGAKNIGRLLKHEFPGVKFSVASDSYAGGCSIDVHWTQLPGAPDGKQVDALIDANFSTCRFDGMTDSTDYDRDPWREQFRALFGSASYVHASPRIPTAEELAKLEAQGMEQATAPASKARRGGPRL